MKNKKEKKEKKSFSDCCPTFFSWATFEIIG